MKSIHINVLTPEEFSDIFNSSKDDIIDLYAYDRKILKSAKTGEYFMVSPDDEEI